MGAFSPEDRRAVAQRPNPAVDLAARGFAELAERLGA
jgi:hypothetical protein